eukprot:gnl/Hemi2/360_TR111_c0_g1_i1.p2 gnl/Hemi2/360_TR111_c0_g1~~gnl/Hemi2/360_TR111_c0_g1_i1.p2  ORF type:complete len:125 (+),score=46.20 gnl/Hemi2/360_TR111_c0_g1_i1:30-404(+)
MAEREAGGGKAAASGGGGGGGEKAERGERKKDVVDLSKYMEQQVRVKFSGGREVLGVLKGYDQLVNLVLDDTQEFLRDPNDPTMLSDETRMLGLTVCRGTAVMLVCPEQGTQEIPNPFLQAETI